MEYLPTTNAVNALLKSIFLVYLLSASINSISQSKINYFESLEKFEQNDWYTGNYDISNAFEKAYQKYHNKKDFKKKLIQFTNKDVDKTYWIATYLNDSFYNNILNEKLSTYFLKQGIKLCKKQKNQEDEIGFLFVIGKYCYFSGKKTTSKKYLIPAYKLSQKFPGNVPAWESNEIAEEVYNFIQKNL